MLPLNNQSVGLVKSRLAPTPSGYLHRGNGFSFVLTWLLLRHAGGKLLLRIDDADTARARPEYLEDIFQSLDWLGLDWDLGPEGPDVFVREYSQQHRFTAYLQLLEVLKAGGALYACQCSRRQLQQQAEQGIREDPCRSSRLSFASTDHAWRLVVGTGEVCFQEWAQGLRCLDLASRMGDFVVRRRGGLPAYQIASLADDMQWGINLIVRGEDLLYSTAAQVFLAEQLMGKAQDPDLIQTAAKFREASFLHHPLLLDEKGEKLSKSAGSTALRSLREAGGNPLPIYAQVASYLALPADAAASLQDMLQAMQERS